MTEKRMSLDEYLDYCSGKGVVVRRQYGNRVTTTLIHPDSLEAELWQDAAFTNGAALVRITIEYAPDDYKDLMEKVALSDGGDGGK